VGRLIPAGTGLAYHKERQRKRLEGEISPASAPVETVQDEEVSEAS
jgi:DNA-directed RNA polymerase subunit beta'